MGMQMRHSQHLQCNRSPSGGRCMPCHGVCFKSSKNFVELRRGEICVVVRLELEWQVEKRVWCRKVLS